jgi:hypothetical protein
VQKTRLCGKTNKVLRAELAELNWQLRNDPQNAVTRCWFLNRIG